MLTRFAPAPTGFLHLGHVLNAVRVWGLARDGGGRVVLRIEDHDAQRSRPEFTLAIREDLAWLGFTPDDEAPPQSARGHVYRERLEPLVAHGLVYGCDCTRQELASGRSHDSTRCRDRGLGVVDGVGWRVVMEAGLERFVDGWRGAQHQDPARQGGDVLVRDRLGWTYQWAVIVDDWLQNVTHVVRGEDLLESTGRQIRLARLAGRPEPAAFFHHGLIMKGPTQKLSKSDGDAGVRQLRAAGWTAQQVIAAALERERRSASA